MNVETPDLRHRLNSVSYIPAKRQTHGIKLNVLTGHATITVASPSPANET